MEVQLAYNSFFSFILHNSACISISLVINLGPKKDYAGSQHYALTISSKSFIECDFSFSFLLKKIENSQNTERKEKFNWCSCTVSLFAMAWDISGLDNTILRTAHIRPPQRTGRYVAVIFQKDSEIYMKST